MPNWRQSTKNTKVELFSEVILWKMILDLMHYSLSKDHQHHKWQQQDIISTLPGCAQDKQLTQYLLKPRSKLKMLPNYWKFPNRNVQTYGFVYHDTNGQNHGPAWKTQSFLLSEICMVILWQDYYGKGNLRKFNCSTVGKRCPNWTYLFVHREKGWFSSVYVDDIKLAGKKQNFDPMWKGLNKEVDLGEPTSVVDHEKLGCTQRQCEISKDIVDNYRTMFQSRISAGATEKLPCSENLRISSWSYDMEFHAKKCVELYCELANKTTQQLYKVSAPCIDDHHFKRRRIEIRGRIVKSMLSNCAEMLILGTYWKTWYSLVSEQICTIDYELDQSLWQTMTFITQVNTSNIVMWETMKNSADWDCFKTPILQEILRTQNPLRVEHCAFLEVIRLSRSVGCVRSKPQFHTVQQNQTSFPWMQD